MVEYKEGNSVEETSKIPTEEVHQEIKDEVQKELPTTAILVVLMPNGSVEVSTDLEGFKMQKRASLRDAITMCKSAASELEITVIAKTVAKEIQIQAQQAMLNRQMQQVKNELSMPKGR